MNLAVLAAEVAQLKKMVAKAMDERERYIRLVALLAKGVEVNATFRLVDGMVAFRKEAFDDVPKKWRVDVKGATVKQDSADPNAPDEKYILVHVSDAAPKPLLVVANGGV